MAMHNRVRISMFVLVACAVALRAQAEDAPTTEIIVSARPAQPLFVVRPEFPAGVGPLREPVVVEIVGKVSAKGQFEPERSSGDKQFVDALSSVLRWWRFAPAVDEEHCRAADGPFTTRVTFSGSPQDPHIFVATPKPAAASQDSVGTARFEWVHRPLPRWPAFSRYKEGEVRLLAKVNPEGLTSDVNVLSSFPAGAFDGAAIAAVKKWTLRWVDDPPSTALCVMQRVMFCTKGQSPYLVGCRQ